MPAVLRVLCAELGAGKLCGSLPILGYGGGSGEPAASLNYFRKRRLSAAAQIKVVFIVNPSPHFLTTLRDQAHKPQALTADFGSAD